MKSNVKSRKKLSQAEIDRIVVSEADNDPSWGRPIRAHRRKPALLSIPAELAGRAAFLARLQRQLGTDEWVIRVIRERVELEEAAFVTAKRELAKKNEA